MSGKMFIGTSGWNYKHWKGNFYPAGLKIRDQFFFYQQKFDTVEINNSFYKLPDRDTFVKWKMDTPNDFVFAVKANRFITHMKKLIDPAGPIKRMLDSTKGLGEKLGPILFQLPPRWRRNTERFEKFLAALPADHRYAFEFREESWYHQEILQLLKRKKAAFCIYELAGHVSPMEVTANFVYLRLHGPGDKYQGSYTEESLRIWKHRCLEWLEQKKDVYVYFDNDENGYAALNAVRLKKLMAIAAPRDYKV